MASGKSRLLFLGPFWAAATPENAHNAMTMKSLLTFMIQIRYTNTSPRRRLTFLSFRTFRMQQSIITFGPRTVHATEQTARKLCQRIVRARICLLRTITTSSARTPSAYTRPAERSQRRENNRDRTECSSGNPIQMCISDLTLCHNNILNR